MLTRERISMSEFASKSARRSPSESSRVCDGSRARSKRSSSIAVQRIDRRELVDHEQPAAGPRRARHLRENELGPRDVVQHGALADQVERAGLDVEVRDVSLPELDVRKAIARVFAATVEQLGDEIDADHFADARRERVGEVVGIDSIPKLFGALACTPADRLCERAVRRGRRRTPRRRDRRVRPRL